MKRLLSFSIDVDNHWTYLKTRGDSSWEDYPSFLDEFVPLVLERLAARDVRATFFLVGADAARRENAAALRRIADAGHEIGNHSFRHEPWLHRYSLDEIDRELESAEHAIVGATGQRPIGFRGPGYSHSADVLEVLVRRGYLYDGSSLPSSIGPLARLYYFAKAPRLSREERARRDHLFGRWRDAFRPLRPHSIAVSSGRILEIPVTTMPWLRLPIHLSYLLYLSAFSRRLSRAYLSLVIAALKTTAVEPSFLVHPLDLLGSDVVEGLDFFPAMRIPTAKKLEFFDSVLAKLQAGFRVVTMEQHARHSLAGERGPVAFGAADASRLGSETRQ